MGKKCTSYDLLNMWISFCFFQVPSYKQTRKPTTLKPNLKSPTTPVLSRVILKSHEPYQICDTLDITIEARDVKNKPKQYGGDYFWAWIHNNDLRASAPADEIIDHQNGNYTVRFKLHWRGKVVITVNLVHSSEAVSVLRRVRDTHPARCGYEGKFEGKFQPPIIKPCHITKNMYNVSTFASLAICNFTDKKTGFPWFCVKPEHIGCDTYNSHQVLPASVCKTKLSAYETKLFME